MKIILCICVSIIMLVAGSAATEELSLEKQWEIIQRYLLVSGQANKFESLPLTTEITQAGVAPIKCGTPATLEFVLNRDKFSSGVIESLGELVEIRPTGLGQTAASPSGRFLIHYTTTGPDAIPGDIPNYADSVARIFDEVYYFLIDTLGYPDPPTDDFYPSGGTAAFDVYLLNLGFAYGLTYLDSAYIDGPNTTRATAFMELENDYVEISQYANRPLDAVRVTCAHEFFHVIQFGIDFTEGSVSPDGYYRSYWMEMSATWAEEQKYDDINDYYYYLPHFFDSPWASIQQFSNSFDLHPYASMLYPLFLSERHSPDLIRDIWLRCAALNPIGDDFPAAAEFVIDNFSGGTESFASTFHEFTLWNYFTDSRAGLAPDGIGYEERADYEEFMDHGVDSVIAVYRNYDDSIIVDRDDNPWGPDHNAAFYMRLDEIQTITPDTSFWNCVDGAFPTCNDSVKVIDTTSGYDIMHIDSIFSVGFDLDPGFPHEWGFNIVYQLEDFPDSAEVDETTLPFSFSELVDFDLSDLERFRSMAFIISPASDNRSLYDPDTFFNVGYQISTQQALSDSSLMGLSAAFMAPYPNPAVVAELDGDPVMFKFQVPMDSEGFPLYGERYSGSSPSLYVDIYTVAGERVCTLAEITLFDEREGAYWTEWDLNNSEGKEVASGVYVAYGRLYGDSDHSQLLADDRAKVLVIR